MTDHLPHFNSPLLKQILRNRILNEMIEIPIPRCIYGEQDIIKTINFIYDFKFESDGPPCDKIYSLEYDHEAIDVNKASNVIFYLYPVSEMIDVLASMIFKNEQQNIKKVYWVYFVPFVNYLCMEKIEKLGIKDKIRMKNLNFDFIPFNEDLFSLELSKYLDPLEEDNCIYTSLLKLNRSTGRINNYLSIGEKSTSIMKKVTENMKNLPEIEDASQGTYMIVLDRALDYITPMVTAFTYEGLLDLFFGIKFNQIEIPGKLMDSPKQLDTFLLYNPKDAHYPIISKMKIRDVPEYLKIHSEMLSKTIKKKKEEEKSLESLNFLNKELMPELLLMQYHKNIVVFLLNQINSCQFINTATIEAATLQSCQRSEDSSYLGVFYDIDQVMKLEILSSQVSEFGNYFSRYEKNIYKNVLDCYHPRHLITVKNLANQGILRSTKQPLKWKELCEKYDLLPDEPHCYTEIHTIYSALLVRFVELFLTNNLNEEKMKLLSEVYETEGSFKKIQAHDIVYLYFIGGVTYPEVEAFRILGEKHKLKFVICTTDITNGRKIIRKCF